MAEQARARTVEQIEQDAFDQAGDAILKVYTYNPPDYAIYRTRDRLIVQFSTDPARKAQQRARIVPLAPMRGQINGLIDGWRSADEDGTGDAESDDAKARGTGLLRWWHWRRKRDQFRKVCRYDRRVADAIITAIEDPDGLELAQMLLAQVKNDLIAERTAIARGQYVTRATALVLGLIALTGVLAAGVFERIHAFPFSLIPAWTAVAGGSVGAFFSIATGLKNREIEIDLQNRENRIDVTLRMATGAIAGGVLYGLFAARFTTTKLFDHAEIVYLSAGEVDGRYSDFTVFLIGFVAGFSERLVPNLLSKTNFGTPEPAGQDTPIRKVASPEAAGPKEGAKPAPGVPVGAAAAAAAKPNPAPAAAGAVP